MIKFSEWRPVGVCDSAPPNQMKAQMFDEAELEIILAPGVTRENWHQNPKVRKIIQRRAQEVARMSTLTQGMKHPRLAKVRLVGAVLSFDRTPRLNRESAAGKLQFFQVEFVDSAQLPRKAWGWLAAVLAFLGASAALVIGWQAMQEALPQAQLIEAQRRACAGQRDSTRYFQEVVQAQAELAEIVRRLELQGEAWAEVCLRQGLNTEEKERRLIQCYDHLQKLPKASVQTAMNHLTHAGECVEQLCERPLPGLLSACRQLDF